MAAVKHEDAPVEYVHLSQDCGLCGSVMLAGDKFVALTGNADSTGYSRSKVFPSFYDGTVGYHEVDMGRTFLIAPWARRDYKTSREMATVHHDCLEMFKQAWDDDEAALDGAWIAAAWTLLWRDADSPRLGQPPGSLFRVPAPVAARLGMAGLATLPPPETESFRLTIDCRGLLEIERLDERPAYSGRHSDSLVYAFLPDEVDAIDATVHFKYGFARLTFPCGGTPRNMSIWDTPSPPDPERDCGPFPFMTDRVRFHTVPLDRVSGLTFLCQSFRIEAIHAHTGVSPTAKPTFDRMLSVSRPGLTWIYLPVSPADRVLEFGARLRSPHLFAHPRSGTFSHHLGWLFRLRLAGDVWLGRPTYEIFGTTRDFVLCREAETSPDTDTPATGSNPMKLIYQTNLWTVPHVLALGVLASPSWHNLNQEEMTPPFRSTGPFDDHDRDEWGDELDDDGAPVEPEPTGVWYTSAPLENVIRIDTLHDPDTGFCRGMLLEYANGAQRAVGDCRVGVDPVTTYTRPVRLCISRGKRTLPRVEGVYASEWDDGREKKGWVMRVKCSGLEEEDHGHQGDEGEWKSYELRGWLVFKVGGDGHYFIDVRQHG